MSANATPPAGSPPPPTPTPDDRKVNLEIAKLNEEIEQLRSANTWYATLGRNIWPIASGILTIAISIILGLITWRTQKASTQQDQDKIFFQSIQMATDPKGGNDGRIAGIWSLSQYWRDPRYQQILASTLSAILITDPTTLDAKEETKTQLVRQAAAEVIGTAIYSGMNINDAKKLRSLLYGEGDKGALGTVTVDQQYLTNLLHSHDAEDDDVVNDKLFATREAIRKNWVYLEDANFFSHDLTKILLYKADLKDAFLGNATLTGANLCNADLTNANVNGADFSYANLSGANLTGTRGWSTAKLQGANIAQIRNAPADFDSTGTSNEPLNEWLNSIKSHTQSLPRDLFVSCVGY
jgi:hypothetical protein